MHKSVVVAAVVPFVMLATLASSPLLHAEGLPETIIVTASRIPMPLAAVGSSVSVIDREQIEARQSVFAIDLLADIPGFAVSRSGGVGSQTQVRVRGAEANQLLVLIDGIEANDPAGNDEFAFENLTTWDIERIEVVRGPQSALWGSDALSGVVNVITRQPTDAVSTQGFAEAGSFNTWSGGARLSGKLLGTRTGFSVSHVDSDGINNSLTGDEKDGYRNTTATLTLAGNPATNLALDFIGRYTGTTKAYDTTDFVVTGLPADSADVTDVGLGYFRAGGSLSLMDGQWTQRLRTAWTTTDSDNRNEFGANGSMAADKYGVYYQTTWHFGADSRGVPRAMNNTGNAVTLALEHEREEFSQRGTATPFGDPNQDQNLETSAAVLELLLTPVDRLSVSLSGRYDHNSDFDSVSTARVTTTWSTETTGTRLHASFGTGQKAPTFSERYGFYADQFVGNPDLKPETSTGWELGFEQQLLASRFGDRFTAGATYFHEDLKDEIDGFVFDPTSSLFTAANLEGKSHRRGVEAVLNARIADDLNVSGSYTYVDATQPDAGSGLQTREIRRPQNSASFNVNWRFLETRAQLNANLNYTGHQYDTYFEVAPPFGTRTINLQNYYLLGIAASYRVAKQTQVYARLENALNEHYAEVYGYNTPRRNVYAGFRLDF